MASMQEEMGSYSIIIQKILPTRNYHLIADNIFYSDETSTGVISAANRYNFNF
jgi:hypothetical protein